MALSLDDKLQENFPHKQQGNKQEDKEDTLDSEDREVVCNHWDITELRPVSFNHHRGAPVMAEGNPYPPPPWTQHSFRL